MRLPIRYRPIRRQSFEHVIDHRTKIPSGGWRVIGATFSIVYPFKIIGNLADDGFYRATAFCVFQLMIMWRHLHKRRTVAASHVMHHCNCNRNGWLVGLPAPCGGWIIMAANIGPLTGIVIRTIGVKWRCNMFLIWMCSGEKTSNITERRPCVQRACVFPAHAPHFSVFSLMHDCVTSLRPEAH